MSMAYSRSWRKRRKETRRNEACSSVRTSMNWREFLRRRMRRRRRMMTRTWSWSFLPSCEPLERLHRRRRWSSLVKRPRWRR